MIFNEILGPAARYTRALARLAQTQEDEGVRALAGELGAQLVLENDRPEWGAIARDYRVAVMRLKPADGANLSRIRIRNPADSGILATLEYFDLMASAAGQITLVSPGAGPTDLADASRGRNRDLRLELLQTVCVTSRDAPAAISGTILTAFELQANVPRGFTIAYMLPPNQAIDFFTEAINTELSVSLAWRERELASGEQSL